MSYMIVDDHGNALGSFETFSLAAEILKELVEADPTAAEECVILAFDKKGYPINAYKYGDL